MTDIILNRVEKYMDEGWSFGVAMKKAGITRQHLFYIDNKTNPRFIELRSRYLDKVEEKKQYNRRFQTGEF